ncbi:MAG TPA: hypothetical protein VGH10_00830 [Actinomycetota bacterium]|jgi:hypothetical protein
MSRRSALALRLGLVAVAAGAVAGLLAGFAGTGGCDTSFGRTGTAVVDPVCAGLVRVMAARMGLVVGLATVVLVLTTVGLSRIGGPDRP